MHAIRFGLYPDRNFMSAIRFGLLHGCQNLARDSGHKNAGYAMLMTSIEFFFLSARGQGR